MSFEAIVAHSTLSNLSMEKNPFEIKCKNQKVYTVNKNERVRRG